MGGDKAVMERPKIPMGRIPPVYPTRENLETYIVDMNSTTYQAQKLAKTSFVRHPQYKCPLPLGFRL